MAIYFLIFEGYIFYNLYLYFITQLTNPGDCYPIGVSSHNLKLHCTNNTNLFYFYWDKKGSWPLDELGS